jgi:hypothetical protein
MAETSIRISVVVSVLVALVTGLSFYFVSHPKEDLKYRRASVSIENIWAYAESL